MSMSAGSGSGSAGGGGGGGGGPSLNSPCAACKFLRRKCTQECIFAPYFPPDQPQKFASVHKVFGASNVAKLLKELTAEHREDAVNSLAYEADERLRDPVYGCVGLISILQHRLKLLHHDLEAARKELATYVGSPRPAMLPLHHHNHSFAQHHQAAAMANAQNYPYHHHLQQQQQEEMAARFNGGYGVGVGVGNVAAVGFNQIGNNNGAGGVVAGLGSSYDINTNNYIQHQNQNQEHDQAQVFFQTHQQERQRRHMVSHHHHQQQQHNSNRGMMMRSAGNEEEEEEGEAEEEGGEEEDHEGLDEAGRSSLLMRPSC